MFEGQSVWISEPCRRVLAKLARQWGGLEYGQVIERLAIEQQTREELHEYATTIRVRDDGLTEIVRRLKP